MRFQIQNCSEYLINTFFWEGLVTLEKINMKIQSNEASVLSSCIMPSSWFQSEKQLIKTFQI